MVEQEPDFGKIIRAAYPNAHVVWGGKTQAVDMWKLTPEQATLIAAAPALLEACQFSLSVHKSQGLFDLSERMAAHMLEAAIRQAEGKE